jgi:hypothetical protein
MSDNYTSETVRSLATYPGQEPTPVRRPFVSPQVIWEGELSELTKKQLSFEF